MSGWRSVYLALALGSLAALALLVAVFVSVTDGGPRAAAEGPQPGVGMTGGTADCSGQPVCRVNPDLDFSISATGCDSDGVPTAVCSFASGETFTLSFNMIHLPTSVVCDPSTNTSCFQSYDSEVDYSAGLSPDLSSMHQIGADTWPDCGFPAFDSSNAGRLIATCAVGVGAASSTYVGELWHLDVTCGVDTLATLTIVPGFTITDVLDSTNTLYYIQTMRESLTIFCGNPPTPTPSPTRTPGGATDTPSATPTNTLPPTDTPTPLYTNTPTITPTRTPRSSHVMLGDVDGDLEVNSLDALWVLWYSAGIVVDVPLPDAADLDDDGVVNATDALYILWVEADEVTIL